MPNSIVFLGASGAVGSATLQQLHHFPDIEKILLLGRREIDVAAQQNVDQQQIDVTDATSYEGYIVDFNTAICTLGVGQPSKVSKEDFVKIDKTAVLDFAKTCKSKGVNHFQLLSSIGADASSRNHYLRTKGELVQALEELHFDRLSIFQPSMILTPTNRYGFSQAIVLKVWPLLDFILLGKAKKYRGILVEELGKAIANNIRTHNTGTEYLQYDQFKSLAHEH